MFNGLNNFDNLGSKKEKLMMHTEFTHEEKLDNSILNGSAANGDITFPTDEEAVVNGLIIV